MRKLSLLFSFSLAAVVGQAATLTVTTTDNSNTAAGQLSLKQALEQAQTGDTIAFNIPGAGPHVIKTPDEGYPIISRNDLTIDGYTQPGSSPNTNPILGANNAQIRIIIDSSEGPNQRTPLGPLNNPGYGDSESAIIAIHNSANFKARGLSFRSRATAGSAEDPDIYCFAFIDASQNAHISGCWFGIDPDGVTRSGGRASAASFKGEGGAASSGMIIGTNGDGANDRGEFNVHVGMGLAIHLETPDVRVSGNFINILPDGKTILPAEEVGEAIENGAGANMIIGTNGDGVSDENECNVIGSVNYRVIVEFWRPQATGVIFAGNYVGVNTDRSATAQSFAQIFDVRKQSSIRIGSDGDGVSDDIEENVIFSQQGSSLLRWHGSNGDAGGVDAAKIVFRNNHMEKNALGPIPFADGTPVPFSVYYANYVADADTRTEFAPTLQVSGSNLTGTVPPSKPAFGFRIIDFYTVDPDALAQGLIHPVRRIGSVVDNGAGDGDAAANAFSVPISSLNLTAAGPVAAAVTYSQALATEAGGAVTSPFSTEVMVAPSSEIRVTVAGQTAGTISFSWTGGSGKFLLQKRPVLGSGIWTDLLSTSERTAVVPRDGAAGFFRVQDSYTGADVIPLSAALSGAAEKPNAVSTPAAGIANISIAGNTVHYLVTYEGLLSSATAGHIHGPFDSQSAGGVMKGFAPAPSGTSGFIQGTITVDDTQRGQLLNGLGYVNIHTVNNGGGEIRGQILRRTYTTAMNGANERPNPVTTDGTGTARIDVIGAELRYSVNWNNLGSSATAGHIHLPATAEASAPPVVFFTNITGASGAASGTLTPGPNVFGALADGKAYVNIHSVNVGGGEIRGQLAPQ